MYIEDECLRSAHIFAGAGGDMCGFTLAGIKPTFAVEINSHRCRTLRLNFPACQIFEGPIQHLTLANYPSGEIPIFFITFPCDHYTVASHIHDTCTGDALYLEALREVVLRYPEIVILENVLGIRRFKRLMETFRALPLYHCTECVLYGVGKISPYKRRPEFSSFCIASHSHFKRLRSINYPGLDGN